MGEQDITVRENPALEQFTAGFRQVLLVVGGWAVGKGYLESDTVAMIGTLAVILGPLLYGQIKQWNNHKKIVTLVAASDKASFK